MKKGHIFFISGIAGAGKGTVIKEILKDKDLNLKLTLSCKTRELRVGEVSGIDYIKMTEDEFKKAIQNGEFLEYNYLHNQAYYGTRYKDIIDEGINLGNNIIKEVDILILPKILEEKKIDKNLFTYIFIDIPLDLIKTRMQNRGDNVDGNDYKFRVDSAKKEKELLYLADYVIDGTQSKEKVLNEVKNIIINQIKL